MQLITVHIAPRDQEAYKSNHGGCNKVGEGASSRWQMTVWAGDLQLVLLIKIAGCWRLLSWVTCTNFAKVVHLLYQSHSEMNRDGPALMLVMTYLTMIYHCAVVRLTCQHTSIDACPPEYTSKLLLMPLSFLLQSSCRRPVKNLKNWVQACCQDHYTLQAVSKCSTL